MIEEYKNKIRLNNDEINELEEIIKKHYDSNFKSKKYNSVEIFNVDELEKILIDQKEEINRLNIIIDIGEQNLFYERNIKIEQLKEKENDKSFSKFYREGLIEINLINVSVDKFYIKIVKDENNDTIYSLVCTDKRIDKNIFNTFEDENYKIIDLHKLKNSKIFYDMYQDKRIFVDDKIKLNTKEELEIFTQYIDAWTKEKHKMVAETMV